MPESSPRYLLVTHIPFVRAQSGEVLIDSLWARDLEGLAGLGWPIRICAPELSGALPSWGPGTSRLPAHEPFDFIGFPPLEKRADAWKWLSIRNVLRREVGRADVVHTSNFFSPYVGLSYAHDVAVKTRKKTIFVIAEDFYDMLDWEWVRTGSNQFEIHRRRKQLAALERRVRLSASTADLTFLHTPAAVQRFRNSARNGIAIRQPGHESTDVIPLAEFEAKCVDLAAGAPLRIIAACRHKALKGLDFLISSIHLLARRGIYVSAELYGDGPQTHELGRLAETLGLTDRVFLPGTLTPGSAVYRAISGAHLFAMPHRTTDFGRAFFDALAGGTPVLAFRTPASIDTVRHGEDGLICALDDVEALADAIAYFHKDRGALIRCATNARNRALENTRSLWYELRAGWTRQALNERTARG